MSREGDAASFWAAENIGLTSLFLCGENAYIMI